MSYTFTSFNQRVTQTLEHIVNDLGSLRTGRGSVQLVDKLKVEAYGTWMDLQELATITLPEPHLILIKPYDPSLVQAIEKAVAKSDLNLRAVPDQGTVKLPIPPLTEERRKELVKVLYQKLEDGRVMVRNVRLDAKKEIEAQKGQEGISEDDVRADIEELDRLNKAALEKIDLLGKDKEKELMTV